MFLLLRFFFFSLPKLCGMLNNFVNLCIVCIRIYAKALSHNYQMFQGFENLLLIFDLVGHQSLCEFAITFRKILAMFYEGYLGSCWLVCPVLYLSYFSDQEQREISYQVEHLKSSLWLGFFCLPAEHSTVWLKTYFSVRKVYRLKQICYTWLIVLMV